MKEAPEQSSVDAARAANDATISATQRVADELRHLIIQGKFTPGEKLKVETLKALLQTGASPIREALSLLTSDHLVERIDQRGFRVAAASEKHFREILMLRCALEDYLHKAFHKVLISASDSPILLRFCNQLYDLNIRYRYIAGTSTRYAKRDVAAEHNQILDAAIARDTEAACKLLVRHYEVTGEFLADEIGLAFD